MDVEMKRGLFVSGMVLFFFHCLGLIIMALAHNANCIMAALVIDAIFLTMYGAYKLSKGIFK